ncbi:MAG TPA: hypothetical protein VGQ90_06960 [Stellaceae bacterium]|jgi:hypothetical protein|nr:hypothetical protein [Stellaceae bacterium]
MQSGNGIDLAAVYQLLTEVAQTVRNHSAQFERVDARLDDIDAGLRELRLTLYQYHEAVVGQGISLTRLDERVQRIEAHLGLDPLSA